MAILWKKCSIELAYMYVFLGWCFAPIWKTLAVQSVTSKRVEVIILSTTIIIIVRYCHKCLKYCLLSFVLGAVSPAVVVPSMLLLQEGGYGVEKGVPTLLMAAGSFDDILAITGFNTCLGMAFSTGTGIRSQRAVLLHSRNIDCGVTSMA